METGFLTKILMWLVGGIALMVGAISAYIIKREDERYERFNEIYRDLDDRVSESDTQIKLLNQKAGYIEKDLKIINEKIDDLPARIAMQIKK